MNGYGRETLELQISLKIDGYHVFRMREIGHLRPRSLDSKLRQETMDIFVTAVHTGPLPNTKTYTRHEFRCAP